MHAAIRYVRVSTREQSRWPAPSRWWATQASWPVGKRVSICSVKEAKPIPWRCSRHRISVGPDWPPRPTFTEIPGYTQR
jgi:hypothetical protein